MANLADFHEKISEGIVLMGSNALKYGLLGEGDLPSFTKWLSSRTLGYILTNALYDIIRTWFTEVRKPELVKKGKKKLVPTLLGKIVARHYADPFIANDLIEVLKVSGDLDLAIENYTNLLYELRLFIIANDDSEYLRLHSATYEVQTEEFPFLSAYDISNNRLGDPPTLEEILETRMKIKEKDLHKKYLQIKALIEKEGDA